MSRGTIAQKERWAPDLLTLDKIGAWAITEPGSGSDAFGAMKSTARRDGDEYLLNGSKTFITNGPYADTIVFICKLDEGEDDPRDRKVLQFVLDKGMPGLEQSKPLRKMGLHSSPTGELFLDDVRVGRDRLLGETEDLPVRDGRDARRRRSRWSAPASPRWRSASSSAASSCASPTRRTRVQFGQPIGELPAHPAEAGEDGGRADERRRTSCSARSSWSQAGKPMSLSPRRRRCKLYSAQAAMERRPRGGAALRRQRLHGRVPGRAALPRRQGPADLRAAPTRSRSATSPARCSRSASTCRSSRRPAVGSCPTRRDADEDDIVGHRRRSRAGDAARRVPRRDVPDAARAPARRSRGGRPIRAGSSRSTASTRAAACGACARRFDVTFDTAFADVVAGCADPTRRTAGSTSRSSAAYTRLHELGWAHSVEVVAGRRARRRRLRRAHRRVVRRRVDVPHACATRRRWRSWALVEVLASTAPRCSTCSGRRRTCARSAPIDIAPFGVPRRLRTAVGR